MKRFARRLQVRFWNQGETHPKAAYTTNISASGMFVSTSTPLPSGSRVRVEVSHGTKSFMVEGLVVHAARVAPVLRQLKESGMGIRFLSIEDLMTELIPDIASEEVMHPPSDSQKAERPRRSKESVAAAIPPPAPTTRPSRADDKPTPRIERPGPMRTPGDERAAPRGAAARRPAPTHKRPAPALGSDHGARCSLEFATLEELRAAFERDLRKGGVFVSTDRPARLHARLMVDLRLPQPLDRVVSFAARVVHVLPPVAGSAAPAGMGLEFSDPDRVVRELSALLEVE
jgi:Tfp pilus assembly protein PilZ